MTLSRLIALIGGFVLSTALMGCASISSDTQDESPPILDPASIRTNTASIGHRELDELASNMMQEITDAEEMQRTLQTFLQLNSIDSEYLLSRMRMNVMPDAEISAQFDRAYRALNQQSMDAHGVPAHLAGARGLELDGEAVFNRFGLTPEIIFPDRATDTDQRSAELRRWCPSINVPYRFNHSWRAFRFGSSAQFRNARQYSGCGLYHTQFRRNISYWNSISGAGYCVVGLNNYGSWRLAGDRRGFYYKWWTVPSCGLNPFTIAWSIRAR